MSSKPLRTTPFVLVFSLFVMLGALFPLMAQAGGETTREQAYVPCGDLDEVKDGVVDNPCTFDDVIELSKRIIMGWIIAGVTIATMGFAYAGYLYITAMGSQEKISHAHSIFTKTALGFIFMLSAWLIAYAMESIFLTDAAKERSFLQPSP